jgi:hypothetical protein
MRNVRKRKKLLPKPPEPPAGYMYFYWKLVPIEYAEEHAKARMKGFDRRPRHRRDEINGDRWPQPKRGRGARRP